MEQLVKKELRDQVRLLKICRANIIKAQLVILCTQMVLILVFTVPEIYTIKLKIKQDLPLTLSLMIILPNH